MLLGNTAIVNESRGFLKVSKLLHFSDPSSHLKDKESHCPKSEIMVFKVSMATAQLQTNTNKPTWGKLCRQFF